MIIFNTTFSVPDELRDEFLEFIRGEYIPAAVRGELVKEPRLSRVFSGDEHHGHSYALEFKADTVEAVDEWNRVCGKELYLLLLERFKQNVLGYATLMQSVSI